MKKAQLEARLDEVEREFLNVLFRCQYVLEHRFGLNDPVGTRLIAIEDLRTECDKAKQLFKPK